MYDCDVGVAPWCFVFLVDDYVEYDGLGRLGGDVLVYGADVY